MSEYRKAFILALSLEKKKINRDSDLIKFFAENILRVHVLLRYNIICQQERLLSCR